MGRKLKLGGKIRVLRKAEGWTQVQLAERLNVSASYVNLLEHNQRPLTAEMLLRVARLFRVELDAFAEDDEGRIAADLREVFGDILFDDAPVTLQDVRELAANPPVARAILALYRAYRSSSDSARALAAKMFEGADDVAVDPVLLPSEEVTEMIQRNRNHFPELESAAEALWKDAPLAYDDLPARLVRYLFDRHQIEVRWIPAGTDRAAVRRFDPVQRTLALSEMLSQPSRRFQLAHQLALLTLGETFDQIIGREALTTPDSRTLARVALANYFAGAVLMPYAETLTVAEEHRYDVEVLQNRFCASFEQVAHRLTTLQRPGAEGIPLHFVRVDIAGNVSKRFSQSGIRFARFSGSCPRWNVHTAFLTPGTIRTQISRMPDGSSFFCIARTVRKNTGGYGSPETLMSVGLGCPVEYARKMVYADGVDVGDLTAAVPIGVTCRLCDRTDCEQRAFPPVHNRLKIDENVRAISFYAPSLVE